MNEHNPSSAMLIMVLGLPGSGKTYFAKALAEQMGAMHFNSDRIRKEQDAHIGYSTKEKNQVYTTMFNRVTEQLTQGHQVIVDATFSKAEHRSLYLNWAKEHGIPARIIMLVASEQITRERVSKKRLDSDADYAVYLIIKEQYEPLTEHHLILRSDEDSLEVNIQKVMDFFKNSTEAK